jgi:HEAT repeat protein
MIPSGLSQRANPGDTIQKRGMSFIYTINNIRHNTLLPILPFMIIGLVGVSGLLYEAYQRVVTIPLRTIANWREHSPSPSSAPDALPPATRPTNLAFANLSTLEKTLRHADWHIRKEVVEVLGERLEPQVLPVLQRALRDQHEVVRAAAALYLGQTQEPQVMNSLLSALRDSHILVRQAATVALQTTYDLRAFMPLLRLLEDSDTDVRRDAAKALKQVSQLVHVVMFGDEVRPAYRPQHTLCNLEVSNLTESLPQLQCIVIETASCDRYQVERFLSYALNALGQPYFKHVVEAEVYGNPQHLPDHFQNLLTNICKAVHIHAEYQHRSVQSGITLGGPCK